jgi:ADP-ribosyl-[dinitrogen reductase] hydrolase
MNMTRDIVLGSLMGLAIGDALGAPVEFKKKGSFPLVDFYQDGGEFNLKSGQWTDDTSLMLCLVESFIEKKEFSLEDQMSKFYRWWKEGYMSSTGVCFDIGNTTKAALERFEATKDPMSGLDTDKASNGALMRLAPVPLFFHDSFFASQMHTQFQCQSTHGPKSCLDSAALLSCFFYKIVQSDKTIERKNEIFDLADVKSFLHHLSPEYDGFITQSIYRKNPEEINAQGLAYNTLEAALYGFYHYDNFIDGLKFVVNLGEDSDTVGAVYGQLAGAFYGLEKLPKEYILGLDQSAMIMEKANLFWELIEQKGLFHD